MNECKTCRFVDLKKSDTPCNQCDITNQRRYWQEDKGISSDRQKPSDGKMSENIAKITVPTYSIRIKIGDWEMEASGYKVWVEKQIGEFIKLIKKRKGQ